MVPIVGEKREEIAALCRRYCVRRLDLFGSAARGFDFTPEPDTDLLIEDEPGPDSVLGTLLRSPR